MPANFSFTSVEAAVVGDGTSQGGVFTYTAAEGGESLSANFTNTYTEPPIIDLTVQKLWDGQKNLNQPSSVDVQLYHDSKEEGEIVTLSADNNWTHTWTGLTNDHKWTVAESTTLPNGYTSTVSGSDVDGFVITNTYKAPNITLTAHKTWSGDDDPERPVSVAVQLYGNGVPVKAEQTLNADNGWKCSWADLDPAVSWTVLETTQLSTQYSTQIVRSENSFEITNTYTKPLPDTVSVAVEKRWTGDASLEQPASVTVRLKQNGELYDTAKLSAATNWKYVWTGLPANKLWSVEEQLDTLPAGYASVVSGNVADGFLITNRYTTQYGNLYLDKTVGGKDGDRDRLWTFTVKFSGGGTYEYSGSISGTLTSGGTVQLKHGQSVIFHGIPNGTAYSVTEREANSEGYYTVSSGASGTIKAELSMARFEDYKGTIPKMGDSANFLLWSGVLILSGLGMTLMLSRRKNRYRHTRRQ